MELQSISKISKDVYRKFSRFDAFKKSKWRKLMIPSAITVIIAGAIEIFVIASFTYDFESIIALMALMELLMIFIMAYMWFGLPLIGYKLSAKLYSIDISYTWYDNHFTKKAESEEISSISNYTYSGLLKVC